MLRYHIIVSGIVQGVGFRYFTLYKATPLSITGWVRNMSNGMVEINAQSSKENLDKFINTLRRGNGFSKVEDISIKEIDIISDEKKFRVLD